jgi:hypothetical protein
MAWPNGKLLSLRGDLVENRGIALSLCGGALLEGDDCGHQRRDQQHRQGGDGTPNQMPSAAVLADVRTHQHRPDRECAGHDPLDSSTCPLLGPYERAMLLRVCRPRASIGV